MKKKSHITSQNDAKSLLMADNKHITKVHFGKEHLISECVKFWKCGKKSTQKNIV